MATKKPLLTFLIISLIIIVDLTTKTIFQYKNFVVLRGILEVKYIENYGLVYGFFARNIFFTIVIPLIILLVLAYYFLYKQHKIKVYLTSCFVIAGILGNLISRIKEGFVIDFIYIPFLQPIFPNFNIADMSAFLGVLVLIFLLLREK